MRHFIEGISFWLWVWIGFIVFIVLVGLTTLQAVWQIYRDVAFLDLIIRANRIKEKEKN
jgi:hypothetical protein